MIRKRQIKGSFIKKDSKGSHESDDEGDSIDLNKIAEIKSQQNKRLRSNGLQIESLDDGIKPNIKPTSLAKKQSIESVMNAQYIVRVDNGLSESIKHESLMEKYVADKIRGIEGGSDPKEKVELTNDSSTSGVNIGACIGIEEVALPIEFKMANIEATRLAKEKAVDNGGSKYGHDDLFMANFRKKSFRF